jgi:poly(A) polymerase
MKEAAIDILKELRQAGHLAYFVGGCVRDLLMGNAPKDYDIATSARPEQVVSIFPESLTVGAQFGVVLVVRGGQQFEVATFRSDGTYADGRHPSEVVYSDNPRDDVVRRDFTINGLLYDPLTETVLDFVEGQRDIQNQIIRTIGEPERRLLEDKLRLMRAARFAARFNYQLEPETRKAIVKLSNEIGQVSRERIRDELIKLLTEGYAVRGVRLLDETRLLEQILPEIVALKGVPQPPEFHPEGDVWEHTLLMLELMDQTKTENVSKVRVSGETIEKVTYPTVMLAVSVLLHDVGKPSTYEVKDRIRFNNHCEVGARMTGGICERLRFTNKQTERIVQLVRDHLRFKDLPQMRTSTMKRFLRQEGFEEHLELHRLDCLGSHGNLENWHYARRLLQQLGPEEIRPHRLITGDDLASLGYTPGPLYKEILRFVEDAQLDNQIRSREDAQRLILEKFRLSAEPCRRQDSE